MVHIGKPSGNAGLARMKGPPDTHPPRCHAGTRHPAASRLVLVSSNRSVAPLLHKPVWCRTRSSRDGANLRSQINPSSAMMAIGSVRDSDSCRSSARPDMAARSGSTAECERPQRKPFDQKPADCMRTGHGGCRNRNINFRFWLISGPCFSATMSTVPAIRKSSHIRYSTPYVPLDRNALSGHRNWKPQ